ncbi:MAG: tyrosine-type recombinase/integrase [Lachnospiraceae bacterium]|nr:tyrosine-type recombinase/integrase [Lachnospiraceae bacterium]
MAFKYHEQEDKKIHLKLKEMLNELPPFCAAFFRGIEPRTQSRTRLAYAYDLTVFFTFIRDTNPLYKNKTLRDIDFSILEQLKAADIEEYMEYLKYRPGEDGEDIANKESAVKRKISSLKSFYNYFYEREEITVNPAALVHLPKIKEKEIIRLDYDEVSSLLDEAESGEGLTKRQQEFHKHTKKRDVAMLALLLGTGMRVSECVGIDLNDIDLNETAVNIHRKGGKEETVYFSDEVADMILPYYEERRTRLPESGSENALFLSLQNKRISVRSAELMVKKYAKIVTPLKHITPHKLRSTYGTHLYQETSDIYLVADVLGHSDVNTTKKHYAAIGEERRRLARSKVKLRED